MLLYMQLMGAPKTQPPGVKPHRREDTLFPDPLKCNGRYAMYTSAVQLRKPIANLALPLLIIKIWIVLLLLTLLILPLPMLCLIPRLCLILNVLRALPVDMCSWMCR